MYNSSKEKSKVILPEVVLPTNDLNFKRLFASPEFINISKGFLQDLAVYDPLGVLQISSISIETPYNFQEVKNLKDGQKEKVYLNTEVDYACRDENGLRFMLEMQKRDQKYLEKRIAYNTGQKYAQYYARTDMEYPSKYSSLQPVIPIIILVANHFKDNIPVRFLRPYDERHGVYRNNLNLGLEIYVEINKDISKLPKSLRLWLEYLRTGRILEEAPCYLQEAAKMTKRDALSKEERELADIIEKYEQNRLAEFEAGWDKAKEKAVKAEEKATKAEEKATKAEEKATKAEEKAVKAEEKAVKAEEKATKAEEKTTKAEEKVTKIVKRSLDNNLSLETISTITGLSLQEIEKLM